jgi:two-component system sensor histidine kinase BaeS
MRTRLFLAFLAVIVVALISNLIYEHFISRDFEDYVSGTREDKLYWVLANVEGSYVDDTWDIDALQESLHWATMLGFDVSVSDFSGTEIVTTKTVIDHLSPSMKRGISDYLFHYCRRRSIIPVILFRDIHVKTAQ